MPEPTSDRTVARVRRAAQNDRARMNQVHVALAVIGGLVVVLGLLSRPLERLPLSAPLLALLLGVALGPQGLALLDPLQWNGYEALIEEVARLTIAVGLMAIALRLRGTTSNHLGMGATVRVSGEGLPPQLRVPYQSLVATEAKLGIPALGLTHASTDTVTGLRAGASGTKTASSIGAEPSPGITSWLENMGAPAWLSATSPRTFLTSSSMAAL